MDNPNNWCPAGVFVLAALVLIVMIIKWIQVIFGDGPREE